jgi:hypothetical protein
MALTRGDFQTFVNRNPAPGVVGGFASMNPRSVVLAGPGAFKADSAAPVLVGGFAWAVPASGKAFGATQANSILGFVANEHQALMPNVLDVSTLTIPAGAPVTLYNQGDFWVNLAGAVTIGATIYADNTTGAATITSAGGTDTGFKAATAVAANASTTAGSLDTFGVLTVGAVLTGTVEVGDGNNVVVTGTGIPANTFIVSQLTGTAGGVGTYQTTSLGVVAASTAVTFTSGRLVKITR